MKHQRLTELDALRGIAALAVVIYHYFYRYNEIYGHEKIPVVWAEQGQLGVNLFFMISGFVIFWTLTRIQKPFDFVVSRFSRLYPVYWAAVLLTYTVVTIFGLPGREVSPASALANILMFHEYLRIPDVDPVYWTLAVELTFYFWIFLLFTIGQLEKAELIFAFFVVLSIFAALNLLTIHPAIYKILLLKELPFFTAGICIFKMANGGKSTKSIAILLLCLLAAALEYSSYQLAMFLLFFGMLYAAASGKLVLLSFKPLVFLGTISYSLYLIHQNIGYVILNGFYEHHLSPWVGIAVSMATSMALAYLLTRFIERPAQRYIREHYQRSEKIQRIARKFSPASAR